MTPVIADGRHTVEAINTTGYLIAVDASGKLRLSHTEEPGRQLPEHLRELLRKNHGAVAKYLADDNAATFAHLNMVVYASRVFERVSLAEADAGLEAWCQRNLQFVRDDQRPVLSFYLDLCERTRAGQAAEKNQKPRKTNNDKLPEGWA